MVSIMLRYKTSHCFSSLTADTTSGDIQLPIFSHVSCSKPSSLGYLFSAHHATKQVGKVLCRLSKVNQPLCLQGTSSVYSKGQNVATLIKQKYSQSMFRLISGSCKMVPGASAALFCIILCSPSWLKKKFSKESLNKKLTKEQLLFLGPAPSAFAGGLSQCGC